MLVGASLGYASAYIVPGPARLAGEMIAGTPSEQKSSDELSSLRAALAKADAPSAAPAPAPERPPLSTPADSPDVTALESGASLSAPTQDERTREAAEVALKRGDEAMRAGDIVSARRFYEFAAAAGIAAAATAVGQTYDPAYLKSAGVRGVRANQETARVWYEKAQRQGDERAPRLLRSLDQN